MGQSTKQCKFIKQCSCTNENKSSCNEKLCLVAYITLISKALTLFYETDKNLLEKNVYEPAVSGKFAMILNSLIKKKHSKQLAPNLDIEYNKHDDQEKDINPNICKNFCLKNSYEKNHSPLWFQRSRKKIRPDIILHERGLNEKNIFAIEIKCLSTTKPMISVNKKNKYDYEKLSLLTCKKHNYRYDYGSHIAFHVDGAIVLIWNEGKLKYAYKYLWDIREFKRIKLPLDFCQCSFLIPEKYFKRHIHYSLYECESDCNFTE